MVLTPRIRAFQFHYQRVLNDRSVAEEQDLASPTGTGLGVVRGQRDDRADADQ